MQVLQTSPNWSGYGATPGPYAGATGTFNLPRLGPGAKCSAQLSEWVGVDGMRSQPGAGSLIQAGVTESAVDPRGVCSFAHPYVYAWWEEVPDPPQRIPSVAVKPGDSLRVALAKVGTGRWSISLVDITDGRGFAAIKAYGGPGTSAEWILEAPSSSFSCGAGVDPWVEVGLCPMPPYAPATFFALGAAGRTTELWPIEMVQQGRRVSTPSDYLGSAFGLLYTGPGA